MKKYAFIGVFISTVIFAVQGDIEVYFSPKGGCPQAIIQTLQSAKKEVALALYQLSDGRIVEEITNATKRGVKVYAAFDGSVLERFREVVGTLIKSGVVVKVEYGQGLLHDKYAIIDSTIVITGSYNWTNQADNENYENLLIIKSKDLAKAFLENFAQIWAISLPVPENFAVRGKGEYQYVASKKGKVFHYIWCPSAQRISEENRRYFKTREEAIKAGYRPCRKCNP